MMLAPNTRLMLLDALRPPRGFEVDAAIGTTYTLSLDALLIPPAAWAMHAVSDRLDAVDPILLANTLRQFAERTMVFHQAGAAAPFTAGSDELSSFLDEMAFPVRVEQGSTFHPKIWVLRFRSADGEVGYRLLIGSRNLSLDSTWDVLVRLDSAPMDDGSVPATAIADLLRSLPARTTVSIPSDRSVLLESVAEDLDQLSFVPPDGCDSAEIFWRTRNGSLPSLFPTRCDRRLVISPFLGASGLGRLPTARRNGRSVLVSRSTSLTQELAVGFEPFTLTTDATDVEAGDEARRGSELHAKVYAFDDGDRATVILGSANATGAAFSANDEVVVRLTGGLETLGVLQLLGEPADDINTRDELELADLLVEWYAADGEEADDQADDGRFFEEAIRSVASRGIAADASILPTRTDGNSRSNW